MPIPTLIQRIVLEGVEGIEAKLRGLGNTGEKAFKQIQNAGNATANSGRAAEQQLQNIGRHTLEHAGAVDKVRESLHVLHPLLRATGIEFGNLRALSSLAGAGMGAFAGVVSTIAIVALEKLQDKADEAKAYLDALAAPQEKNAFANLEPLSRTLGVPQTALAAPYAAQAQAREALAAQGQGYALPTANQQRAALGTLTQGITGLDRLSADAALKVETQLFDGIAKAGGVLNAELLRAVAHDAPAATEAFSKKVIGPLQTAGAGRAGITATEALARQIPQGGGLTLTGLEQALTGLSSEFQKAADEAPKRLDDGVGAIVSALEEQAAKISRVTLVSEALNKFAGGINTYGDALATGIEFLKTNGIGKSLGVLSNVPTPNLPSDLGLPTVPDRPQTESEYNARRAALGREPVAFGGGAQESNDFTKQVGSPSPLTPAGDERATSSNTSEVADNTAKTNSLLESVIGLLAKGAVALGGPGKNFATGGTITGPGTGTSDSIVMPLEVGGFVLRERVNRAIGYADGGHVIARVSAGERYFPRAEVQKIGLHNLQRLNAYEDGGTVVDADTKQTTISTAELINLNIKKQQDEDRYSRISTNVYDTPREVLGPKNFSYGNAAAPTTASLGAGAAVKEFEAEAVQQAIAERLGAVAAHQQAEKQVRAQEQRQKAVIQFQKRYAAYRAREHSAGDVGAARARVFGGDPGPSQHLENLIPGYGLDLRNVFQYAEGGDVNNNWNWDWQKREPETKTVSDISGKATFSYPVMPSMADGGDVEPYVMPSGYKPPATMEQAADTALDLMGPIGDAGMQVGDWMRTRGASFSMSDVAPVLGNIMMGVGGPEAPEAGLASAALRGVTKLPGRWGGLFNPLPVPQDVTAALGRMGKRTADVGAPTTERAINLGDNKYLGPVTLAQWKRRTGSMLSPAEIDKARTWYPDALPLYNQHFGEDAPSMLGAWLTANVNATPQFAQLSATRTLEQTINRTAQVSPQKQGGLAHDKLMQWWDAMRSGDLSKLGREGSGQKIYDFIDSALGKTTRTFYGDNPGAGAPAVADVHSLRDMGFVDQAMLNWVTENHGKTAAGKAALEKLKRDSEGLSPGEAQYEWAANKMRTFTTALNKEGWMGGGWEPHQLQAVGWTAMSKMLGHAAGTPANAIESNIRTLAYELDFGAGAPYNKQFPEWGARSEAGKAQITDAVTRKIMDFAKSFTGANVYQTQLGRGGWQGYTNPSMVSKLIASPEVTGDVADTLGYLAQQTKVMGYRPLPSANKTMVSLTGEGLKDPAKVQALFDQLRKAHPEAIEGFSPTVSGEGLPGMDFLLKRGGAKITSQLMPSIDRITDSLGLSTESKLFKVEEESRGHDWAKDPTGGQYTQRLGERYGPALLGRLDAFKREELEPAIAAEIARAKAAGLARGGTVGQDAVLAALARGGFVLPKFDVGGSVATAAPPPSIPFPGDDAIDFSSMGSSRGVRSAPTIDPTFSGKTHVIDWRINGEPVARGRGDDALVDSLKRISVRDQSRRAGKAASWVGS